MQVLRAMHTTWQSCLQVLGTANGNYDEAEADSSDLFAICIIGASGLNAKFSKLTEPWSSLRTVTLR